VKGEIRLARGVANQITDHARANPAEECCGLLAGRSGIISSAFPAKNAAGQPETKYEIALEELFGLMREIRGGGLELLGIYHSHPNGENIPSASDIERAYYPDAAYIIISPLSDTPKAIRAFSIREGNVFELAIQLV
jgi:proteasome lid subunit RPN8/RPN11